MRANGRNRGNRRGRRRLAASLAGAGAALAIAAPGAQATLNWDETGYDFGSSNVGVAAAPKTFTLTATCDVAIVPPLCTSPVGGVHAFGIPSVTGDGFAIGTPNTCVTGLLTTIQVLDLSTCQSTVTFTPASAGAKSGSLNLPSGPDIPLSGTAVDPAGTGGGGGASTGPGSTGGATGDNTGTYGPGAKKKCKKRKKRSAAAAKKKKCPQEEAVADSGPFV